MAGKFKVLFIYPDTSKGSAGKFYHGIAFLSAYLKKHGIGTDLIHLTQMPKKESFLALLNEKQEFNMIAYNATTIMFPVVKMVAEWAGKKVPSIIGGIHATLAPDDVMATALFDFLCVGEGEDPLLELCQRIQAGTSYRDIKNLWVRDGKAVIKNESRPLRADLDELPFPDRDIMRYGDSVEIKENRRGVFMASRGCPFNCTFCCNHSLKHLFGSNVDDYVRFRSVENLIGEIEAVVAHYPQIDKVSFHDDILPLRKEWFAEFCREYGKRVGLPFQINCRAELVTATMLEQAKSAGCNAISIGIESGSEAIRKKVLNRPMSDEVITRAFRLCNEAGLRSCSFNMVGIPGETFEDMLKTLRLNALLDIDTIQLSVFYPFPGTKLYDESKRLNLLTENTESSYFDASTLNYPRFVKKRLVAIAKNYLWLISLYTAAFGRLKKRSVLVRVIDLICYFPALISATGLLMRCIAKAKRMIGR